MPQQPSHDKKIRIARVFSDYTGPLAGYLAEQMRLLDPGRFETQLIFLTQRAPEQPSPDGFKQHLLNGDVKMRRFRPMTAWRLARILRRERIDIVHCNRHGPTLYGTVAARLAGTGAVITHVHGMNRCRNWRRRLLYRLLGPRITFGLGCADAVSRDIDENYPGLVGKARTLVNSVDYDRFHDAPNQRDAVLTEFDLPGDAFVFFFPARLVETKGHDLLIDAFAAVVDKHPEARLLLVGEGRLREAIETQARRLGVDDRVLMPGHRSDIPRLMKACDAFVMSSVREGMPISILEAMAAGLPVVATSRGGVRELLDDGRVGLFVDPRTVDRFAEAMNRVIQMPPDQRRALIDAADEHVRTRYHHDVVVKQLEALYLDSIQ